MSLIYLTARKIGPQGQDNQLLTTPRVVSVEVSDIHYIKSYNGGSVVKTKIGGRGAALELWVAESPAQIEVMRDPASTNVLAQDKTLGASAAGTTQGAGTSITKFLTEFTTIGAGVTEAATLDAATAGKTRVVLNNDADAVLKLFPASGETIEGNAADASIDVGISQRVHLYCETAGTWKVATQ